jgi:glycosyltransferase involved in cell wall biosynthesis
MNLCMIGFYQYPIPPLYGGSLAVVAHELVKEFAKNGYPVSVFSLKDSLLPRYEEKHGIRYFRINNPVHPRNGMISQSISSLIYSLSVSIRVNSMSNVDVIQCFDPLILPLLKWSLIKKRPVLLRFGMGFGLSKGWRLVKRPNWAFIKLANQLIVPSHFLKKLIIANLGLPEDKVSVIPNGVNLKQFNSELQDDEIRKKYGLGVSPVILFVGRISPEKGVDLLIESIPIVQKRIKNVKLLVVGPAINAFYMMQLRSLVAKLRLSTVIFTGEINVKEELPKFYAACNLFCCPSDHGEGFGNVALEALASGKPVVSTNSGGLPEIIEDGKVGHIVPINNKEKLANALIQILEDESLQKKMGQAARKRAEEIFSWKSIATQYLRLYKEIIERN